MRVIINSDDFGLSDAVNSATLDSFEKGLISSTTLLVNKQGFNDVINKTETNAILKNRIGLHINLTDGRPLTDAIKKCERFCNGDGMYIYNRSKPCWSLTSDEKKAVHTEIKAQVDKCISHGIMPTHFDSHHHVHTEWGIAPVVVAVAKEYGINKIRLSRNTGVGNSFSKKAYKNALNFFIKKISRITATDYFGSVDDFLSTRLPAERVMEIMVHAMYDVNGTLVDYDHKNLSERITLITQAHEITGYAGL